MVCVKGRTKPKMYERIQKQVKAGKKGGPAGKWSARKAQLAINKYKSQGGGFCGPKTKAQKSMSKWTDEKWGRINPDNKTSRYLPKSVREKLTPAQKRAASRAKGKAGLGKSATYTKPVARLMRNRKK